MKKILALIFAGSILFSCSRDIETPQQDDASAKDASFNLVAYDNSNLGLYRGVFSTMDSSERGTFDLEIREGNKSRASLTLLNGIEYKFNTLEVIEDNTNVIEALFVADGASFRFSVKRDGSEPKFTEVTFLGAEASFKGLKETSRSPVDSTVGLWTCDSCASTGGNASGTFSTVTTTAGTSAEVMIMQNGTDIGGVFALSACDGGSPNESCTISGTVTSSTPSGSDYDFTGTVTYDSGLGSCSQFSGTWTASGGGLNGNFASSGPSNCTFQDNDFCTGARVITCGGSDSGDTSNANQADDPASVELCGTADSDAGGVWYTYTGVTDGTQITASLAGSTFDTKLWVYEGSCGSLVCIGGNDDFGGAATSQLTWTETLGTTYYLYVAGFNSSSGAYTLSLACLTPPSEGDTLANPIAVTPAALGDGCTNSITVPDAAYSNDTAYDASCATGEQADAFFSFTATSEEVFVASGSNNPVISVLSADGSTTYACVLPFGSTAASGWAIGDELIVHVASAPVISTGTTFCLEEFISPSNTPIACGTDTFVDPGGNPGSYDTGGGGGGLGTTIEYTLDAGAGNIASLAFSVFELEATWDFMNFYDGADSSAPLIALSDGGVAPTAGPGPGSPGYTGGALAGDGVTASGQFLTVTVSFDTWGSDDEGWVATASCTAPFAGMKSSPTTVLGPVQVKEFSSLQNAINQRYEEAGLPVPTVVPVSDVERKIVNEAHAPAYKKSGTN